MKLKFYSLFLGALLGTWGMHVSAQELSTTEIDGVTYYEIGSAADLVAFADLVNTSELGANAILTADIDLTGATASGTWETPIGVGGLNYTGTFDGQGHKITGFVTECTIDGSGLFGYTSNATIKNFSIDGELTSTAGTGSGVVGYPSNSTIYNVHSTLNITVPVGGVHHVGGVVGSARGGNTISHCTFAGTMQVAAGSTDNFAGVVAYLGGDSVVFCANYGTITFDDVNCAAGGVAGYLNNSASYVKGCLNLGMMVCSEPEATPKWGGAIVGRLRTHDVDKLTGNCWLEGSATGAGKDNDGNVNLTTANCINAAQLASGEVCFKLNGDQSVIGWYQNLDGTDPQPVLDDTHGQVFMNGHLHCNGEVYEGASYSNENAGTIKDEHNIVDGFCTYCGMFDENYLTPNAEGFYEIANAKQLVWLEQVVNRGAFDVNAVLTADIDFADLLSEEEKEDIENAQVAWTPIGDWAQIRGLASACYKGHFDGQGHKILNFNVTSTCNYYGIFGVISEGSLIENFSIYGTLNLGHKTGGVVGYTRDTACTIRNIQSYLTLNVTEANTTAERPGGIVGSAVNGTTNIENCTYSGILNAGGHTGNIGGIVGYINNNSAAIVNITNCLFDGEIQNGDTADGQCGGIVGYNNGGMATIKNCLSIGTIVASEGNIGQLIGRLNGSNTTFANNYYLGDFVNGTKSGKSAKGDAPVKVTYGDLASGEICWKLNEETFLSPVWRQTINIEDYPVPNGVGAIVYQTPEGFACIDPNDPESFEDFRDGIIANESTFIQDEDLVAYSALVDEYTDAIESWKSINDYDEFIAAYKASFELKENIKASAAKYAEYVKECKDATAYLEENEMSGVWADLIKNYLNEEEAVAPNPSVYPNGSFAYIMENRNLSNEELDEEILFVKQMLENALAGGYTAGTEITRLMANANFASDFEGWTTEADGINISKTDETAPMHVIRGLGNGTFSASQTLSELTNGVYLMSVNSLFRSGTDYTNPFYAGQLYLNNTYNYVMSPGEDVVEFADAEPGVNCLGDDGDEVFSLNGIEGYVPKSLEGASYAFNGERYQNFCATEVTDGTLTVGVRSLGTGLTSDWMPFANVRLWYLGTAEQANDDLAEVLNAYADRANTILDYMPASDVNSAEEYTQYPNISQELITKLGDAVSGISEAATGEEKLKLINTFSELFNEVHACRKAYVDMLDAANSLVGFLDVLIAVDLITDEEYDDWNDLIYETQDHFINGDISTEEALALVKKLNIIDELLPSVDGVYQLATIEQLKLFATLVNSGAGNIKAALANDIDLSEDADYFEPIGNVSNPFQGEFDGQGHKISNFGKYNEEEDAYSLAFVGDRQGFFGFVKNATIKNFSIDGAFTYDGGTGYGAIGWAEGSTLQNIHSALNIASVSTSHHIGGVCGDMRAGSKAIGCSFSGTITDSHNSHDCIAGIGGYSNENCLYENCANYGTVIFTASNSYAGGICGYVNNDSFTGIFNCLNVGKVSLKEGTPTYSGAFVGRLRSHANSKFENNYMLQGSAQSTSGENRIEAGAVTTEQLASGEVCYKLNGDQEEINWYQTLGEDAYPVLFDTHKRVWLDGETYTNTEPGNLEGDLNKDGKVDIADAVTVLNIMAAGEFIEAADLNHDQKIDIADFVTVLNIMAQQ